MEKSVVKSKTFWFGIITAVAPLFPSVGVFMAENAQVVSGVWGMLAIILRTVTKEKVVLVE